MGNLFDLIYNSDVTILTTNIIIFIVSVELIGCLCMLIGRVTGR